MAIENISIIGTDVDTLTASLTTNSTRSCSKKLQMKKTPVVSP